MWKHGPWCTHNIVGAFQDGKHLEVVQCVDLAKRTVLIPVWYSWTVGANQYRCDWQKSFGLQSKYQFQPWKRRPNASCSCMQNKLCWKSFEITAPSAITILYCRLRISKSRFYFRSARISPSPHITEDVAVMLQITRMHLTRHVRVELKGRTVCWWSRLLQQLAVTVVQCVSSCLQNILIRYHAASRIM